MASRSDFGSGTCIAAHNVAVVPENGNVRSAKFAFTPFSQTRKALPCGGVRRSSAKTPFSSSSMLMAEINKWLTGLSEAHARTSID